MKLTTTTKRVTDLDLRKLPFREWPLEARQMVTPYLLERARQDLYPKDWLVERVELSLVLVESLIEAPDRFF
jgi:hypothetical protein